MTPLFESKYTALRNNAQRYYEAVIFPCDPNVFDSWDPKPRIALSIELARINKKERREGGIY